MSDYISRDKLNRKKKYLFQTKGMPFPKSEWFFKFDDVMGMPSADVRENINGEWRAIYQGDEIIDYRCNKCDFGSTFGRGKYRFNFCPNCGADMRGKENDS